MADNSLSDFFLTDSDGEDQEPDTGGGIPVIIPASQEVAPSAVFTPQPAPQQPAVPPAPGPEIRPQAPAPTQQPAPQPAMSQPVPQPTVSAPQQMSQQPVTPVAQPAPPAPRAPEAGDREQRLAAALDDLMHESREIQAAALVSLDGFAMASALPEGMQEDRVGAMSAAILGLGERAAAELGKGKLSQVFIQGEDGYVLLTAAGSRAVLTCLADADAKLGLVLYDMKVAAQFMGDILE